VSPSREAEPDNDGVDGKRGRKTRRAVTLAKSAVATADPDATASDDDASDDDASDDLPAPPKKVVKPATSKPKTKVALVPDKATKDAATLPLPSESKPLTRATSPAPSPKATNPVVAAAKPDKGTASIGWPIVQVRDEPDGRIVGELKRGARVAELARDGEWVKVRANDTTGWIVDQALAKP
jgi:hypothetical protein